MVSFYPDHRHLLNDMDSGDHSAGLFNPPIPVTAGGFASDGEKTLYIRGGSTTFNRDTPTNQFFSLDLTTSWSASSPAWKTLASNTAAMSSTAHNSLALSGSSTLVEWSVNPGITVFNLDNGSSTPKGFPQGLTNQTGLQIAINPSTGQAHVPCAASGGDSMLQFDPAGSATQMVAMPLATEGIMQKITSYSFVWSTVRSSFLLLGGYTFVNNPPRCNEALWEFKGGVWSRVPTKNMPFTDVSNHCMVPAAGGTKMIVFGGQRATDWKAISGIFILDLATMEWSSGTSAPLQEARQSMACTVSGDYFIAWGGSNTAIMGPKPLIYNMKTDQWVDQFTAPSTTSNTGSNTAAIAGGAAGAVVLIGGVIFFLFYRRRKQRKMTEKDAVVAKSEDKDAENKDLPKSVEKPGDGFKDPQDFGSNSVTAYAARTVTNSNGGTEAMVDKDGSSRNPQSFIYTGGDLRNPQYQPGGYPGMLYQTNNHNPQYFEPGTQFQDMQYHPTQNNPQLYAPMPYSAGVSGNVAQSRDTMYPPPPPLGAMRRDSQARVLSLMSNGTSNSAEGSADTTSLMPEEIMKIQLALVKAQQDQEFQTKQQMLARFRADQEAQFQILQQQLFVPASSSGSPFPSSNAVSAPVPRDILPVEPLVPGGVSQSSVSAPVPTVGSEPLVTPSSSATTTTVMDAGYVPAPVFTPPPPSPAQATVSSPASAATTFVTSDPVLAASSETIVTPKPAVSAPVVPPRPTTINSTSPIL
ncbi:hypothetical protein EC991_004086 [Linnemannia zychae]|nr:hypothetical protein EC991_004086 [Linnemannia zychae]